MTPARAVGPLLIMLALLVSSEPAAAGEGECPGGCWTYDDFGQIQCFGCDEYRELIFCMGGGCVCGTCEEEGGSGLCCGKIYYTPTIYPEPGDCGECGNSPSHARTHANRQSSGGRYSAELRQGYSPGLIMLTPTVSYRAPLFAYVYNRCSHTFTLIAE